MKLLFIHGAPAAGKLTVAKALTELIPCRLFDNHAAIDVALTVFDFGEGGFWDLVHKVRSATLCAAADHNVPIVVMTYCYAHPEDLPTFEGFENTVRQRGGEVLPVFLQCSMDETLRRIGNPDRIARGKTSTEQCYKDFVDGFEFTALPRDTCLSLNSEAGSADDTARKIVKHFSLD